MKFNKNFLARMRKATRIWRTFGSTPATAAIQRALRSAANKGMQQGRTVSPLRAARQSIDTDRVSPPAGQPVREAEIIDISQARHGKFLSASCTNRAGTRDYKIYVPRAYRGQALPLIVMLHGCKQTPDDFAVGTGMNAIAEEHGWFVAYPAQMRAANGSNCWNWFKASNQQRGVGEPSIIADITREVMRAYRIDAQRVYVAGLSAGGAMAAIMGTVYPDLYAAVGVHSGLPCGAAHDFPSALAVMNAGMRAGGPQRVRARMDALRKLSIPMIVFHGDRDSTVHPSNGDQVLAQCAAAGTDEDASHPERLRVTVEQGEIPHGRAYTRTIRRDRNGTAIAEHWVVHGAGHAWSGGTGRGSYTDPTGPNASREMLRFFATHRRAIP